LNSRHPENTASGYAPRIGCRASGKPRALQGQGGQQTISYRARLKLAGRRLCGNHQNKHGGSPDRLDGFRGVKKSGVRRELKGHAAFAYARNRRAVRRKSGGSSQRLPFRFASLPSLRASLTSCHSLRSRKRSCARRCSNRLPERSEGSGGSVATGVSRERFRPADRCAFHPPRSGRR